MTEMNDDDKVTMRYEGERTQDNLVCVYTYRGREYKIPYEVIAQMTILYEIPTEVRERVLFWVKMLHNPD